MALSRRRVKIKEQKSKELEDVKDLKDRLKKLEDEKNETQKLKEHANKK